MVKLRIRTKIMAAATFFVMSAAVILGGFDMSQAEATGGTDYVKYTYVTGQTQTYNLPEIPTINYNTLAMQAANDLYTDPRDNYYDSAVVQVNLHDYVFPDNPEFGSYWGYGTGFIIGEHEIMTAAHIIYNKDDGFNDFVKIKVPNSDGSTENSIGINVVSAHIPQDYMDTESYNCDYAILTVSEDLSQYGCYILGMVTDSIMQKNVPIHSLGYYGSTLKISHGTIDTINELKCDFDLYTYKGSSGGPFYVESSFGIQGTTNEEYQIKTYRTVISIVAGGDKYPTDPNNSNPYGTRIRPVIMQFAYDNEYL